MNTSADGLLRDTRGWINDETRLNATNMNKMFNLSTENKKKIDTEIEIRTKNEAEFRKFNAGWNLCDGFADFRDNYGITENAGTPEVLNDYQNNKAYTPYALVGGTKNTTGCKGFPVIKTCLHEDTNLLDIIVNDSDKSLTGNTTARDSYVKDDVINLDGESHYYSKLKIVSIGEATAATLDSYGLSNSTGCTLIVATHVETDTNIPISMIGLSTNPDENWVWCITEDKRECGIPITTQIAAATFGTENISAGKGAFAAGRQNTSNGDYATTFGRSNQAVYASFAAGRGNIVTGSESISAGFQNNITSSHATAFGFKNTATGQGAVVIGSNSQAHGKSSIAMGQGAKAIGDYSIALNGNSRAYGEGTLATGFDTQAGNSSDPTKGKYAISTGYKTGASGKAALSLGEYTRAIGNYSLAGGIGDESTKVQAVGEASISFGCKTLAKGKYSVALGNETEASGQYSLASGNMSVSSGTGSIAIGLTAKATGDNSIAIGTKSGNQDLEAGGMGSIAFGNGSNTYSVYSGVFGDENRIGTRADCSVAIGRYNVVSDGSAYSFCFGVSNESNAKSGTRSILFGCNNHGDISGGYAFGNNNVVNSGGFAAGSHNVATGSNSIAMGWSSDASGIYSTAIGYDTSAGDYGVALGNNTQAGSYAFAVGNNTKANGNSSVAMGKQTQANGAYSFAMGAPTYDDKGNINKNIVAEGAGSFAIGYGTNAKGSGSITCGKETVTGEKAQYAVAAGMTSTANEQCSFAIGNHCTVNHKYSIAIGSYNTTTANNQILIGNYAKNDDTNVSFAVGNGTAWNNRRNAIGVYTDRLELMDKTVVIANGKVTVTNPAVNDNDLVTYGQVRDHMSHAMHYRGVLADKEGNSLYDGCETTTIYIEGRDEPYTAVSGDVVIDNNDDGTSKGQEWIFDGKYWRAYGDVSDYATSAGLDAIRNELDCLNEEPDIVNPSISVTSEQMSSYEVGTKVTPNYQISFDEGSYEFDDSTGVKANSYSATFNGSTKKTSSGSFDEITVDDTTNMCISAQVNHSEGNVPHTNLMRDAKEGKIVAGTVTNKSKPITGYRNWFIVVNDNIQEINSSNIRKDSNGSSTTAKGDAKVSSTKSVTIPGGTNQVIIAIPAGSGYKSLDTVIDVDGMGLNIVEVFEKSTCEVAGRNDYKPVQYNVWVLTNNTSKGLQPTTYKITIN